ncbi:peptidylprolyl isomerase [Methanoplanus sp. FWC-SCC4]|uniref:peptidylprolyl isomerase n=1 Tax=Methanochimaera problematica TaxID=2609417 RepID=A0AA97I399_9EURY|nr:peptidylprolyl isomerase [Methanoplanus sp. FWC-SCC4]WOF17130.1 peptidylprolyl isomerase [Methanoplanus sp. FWC-SCC4]
MTETKVKFETNLGDIIIQLYDDMPVTTGNFEKLVQEGFYDGIIFHRVIRNFMIQAGCPHGTGTGGPGYNIKDEFVKGHSNVRGTLAMANTGQPDTGGSQFFINLVDNTYLDWDNKSTPYKHPVFGEVIEGMDVVDKIAMQRTNSMDKPVNETKIIKATVI